MATPAPTLEELIALLRKTTLPSILVEGTADACIYRRLERNIGTWAGNVLPCGGRSTLLQLFDRRNEFSHVPLAFLADRDTWLFAGTPAQYTEIVWTHGYSLENDAYAGSCVEKLLEQNERVHFDFLLEKVCGWFAFEIEESLGGRSSRHAASIGEILNGARDDLRAEFLITRRYHPASPALTANIRGQYQLMLRGKTLIALLAQLLSHPQRQARYSKNAIVELCVTMERRPDYLGKLSTALAEKLKPQQILPI